MSNIVGIVVEGYAEVVASGNSVSGTDIGILIRDAESAQVNNLSTHNVGQAVIGRNIVNFSSKNCVDLGGGGSVKCINPDLPVRRSKYAPVSTHSKGCICENCLRKV